MQRPATKERARYRSQGSNGNGYQARARRHPLPRVGGLCAIGTCWQCRCGVPRVVARRLDVEMSSDEIANLIKNEAGDGDGDPGQPPKAMFMQDRRRNGGDHRPAPKKPEPRDELGNYEPRKRAQR
jgi:hypothetical protein